MELTKSHAVNILNAGFIENPYPHYATAQALAPLYFDPEYDAWVVTRYDDVATVLKNSETFSSRRPLNSSPGGLGYNFILFCQDPPEHTQLRSFIKHAFTTKRIASLSSWIEKRVDQLLDSTSCEAFDLAEKLAIPLPIMVITNLLGIVDQQWSNLKKWTEMAVGHHNEGSRYPGRKAFMELHTLFKQEIAKRKANPSDDIISTLVHADVNGRKLEDIEIVNFCNTLLIAGNETTASLISNMVNILANQTILWQQLRLDRKLVDPIIEEVLRFDSPVQFLSRKVSKPISICGQTLDIGSNIIVCIGAANRDPSAFFEPDIFNPKRMEKKHLAFSHGIHFCVGAALSRLEANIVLNRLLDRFSAILVAEPGKRYANFFFRGFKNLKIETN